jgi:hypothetical protein
VAIDLPLLLKLRRPLARFNQGQSTLSPAISTGPMVLVCALAYIAKVCKTYLAMCEAAQKIALQIPNISMRVRNWLSGVTNFSIHIKEKQS